MRRATAGRVSRGAIALGLVLSALAAGPARAGDEPDTPSQYRTRLPITLQGSDTLQRLRLPLPVLQQTMSGGRVPIDLRVFDAQGRAMPLAWAAEPPWPRPPLRLAALAPLPWPGDPQGAPAAPAEVRIEWQGSGEVLRVERAAASAASGSGSVAGPRAWLLDLKPLGEARPAALQLDWAPQLAQGTVVNLRAEASIDAQQWQPMGQATLVELAAEGGARRQLQSRLVLQGLLPGQRYLRLVADRPWPLRAVQAELQPPAATGFDESLIDRARWPVGPDGMVELGTVLQPRRVQFHLPGDKGVAPIVLERPVGRMVVERLRDRAQPHVAPAWQVDAVHTAYRILHQGMLVESAPLDLHGAVVEQWRLRAAEGGSLLPEAVTLQWVAPQLVFAAGGQPPYQLAVGRADAPPAALPLATLMPGYESGAEYRLPAATLAAVPERLSPAQAGAAARPPEPARPWWLWAALAGAVVGLGAMAWRLAQDMREDPPA
jgi:Protein of unknown function (DUF3999)